jgi:hypothetical protein
VKHSCGQHISAVGENPSCDRRRSKPPHSADSSNSALASFRSSVSKLSVNQPSAQAES